jgi:hypothetical protein
MCNLYCTVAFNGNGAQNRPINLKQQIIQKYTFLRDSKVLLSCGTETVQCQFYVSSSALLEKPPVPLLLKNFPIFDGTQRFIILFTRALQFSLSWAR